MLFCRFFAYNQRPQNHGAMAVDPTPALWAWRKDTLPLQPRPTIEVPAQFHFFGESTKTSCWNSPLRKVAQEKARPALRAKAF